jgi:ferredoxin
MGDSGVSYMQKIPLNPPLEKGEINEITRREFSQLVLPNFSPVCLTLDAGKRTGCSLCATECATGALIASAGEKPSLVLRQDLCDGCGRCPGVCPEQCLTFERSPESNGATASEAILFEDQLARCQHCCGAVIGSNTMIYRESGSWSAGQAR